MWNDAFQTNCWNMQKNGVPGVPGVPPFGEPIPEPLGAEHRSGTPENCQCSRCSILPFAEHREHRQKTVLLDWCSAKSQAGGRSDGYGTPGTPGTPQKQHHQQMHRESTLSALKQFQFDQFLIDIENGHPADDGCRVNNMAWHFMQTEGMRFDEAIHKAAVIVVSSQVTACEAAYIDVMDLFKRLTQ